MSTETDPGSAPDPVEIYTQPELQLDEPVFENLNTVETLDLEENDVAVSGLREFVGRWKDHIKNERAARKAPRYTQPELPGMEEEGALEEVSLPEEVRQKRSRFSRSKDRDGSVPAIKTIVHDKGELFGDKSSKIFAFVDKPVNPAERKTVNVTRADKSKHTLMYNSRPTLVRSETPTRVRLGLPDAPEDSHKEQQLQQTKQSVEKRYKADLSRILKGVPARYSEYFELEELESLDEKIYDAMSNELEVAEAKGKTLRPADKMRIRRTVIRKEVGKTIPDDVIDALLDAHQVRFNYLKNLSKLSAN